MARRRRGVKPDTWYTLLSLGLVLIAGSLLAGGIMGVFFDPFYWMLAKPPEPSDVLGLLVASTGLLGVVYTVAGLAGVGLSYRYNSWANIATFSALYYSFSALAVLLLGADFFQALLGQGLASGDIVVDYRGAYAASLALFLGAGIARATRWYIGLPVALYGLYETWLLSLSKPYTPVEGVLESVVLSLAFLWSGLGSGLWWVVSGKRSTTIVERRVVVERPASPPPRPAPSRPRSEKRPRLPRECYALQAWPRLVAEKGKDAIRPCWAGRSIYGYYVEDVIGVGGYGVVLKAKSGSGRTVAIKVLLPVLEEPGARDKRRSTILASEMLGTLYKESASLRELSEKSPFIVRLIGMYYDEDHFREALRKPQLFLEYPPAIVMEYMGGGDLNQLLQTVSKQADRLRLDESWHKAVAAIIGVTAAALAVVHSAGYVHSDIKPHNILFNKKPPSDPMTLLHSLREGIESGGARGTVAKLSDLGSAVKKGSELQGYTPIYAPPEIIEYYEVRCADPEKARSDPWCLKNKPLAHPSQDVFALGMTALQALGALTAEGLFSFQLNTNPSNLRYMLPQTLEQLNIPQPLRQVITRMLDPRPENRPGAGEVALVFTRYAGVKLPSPRIPGRQV